MKLVFAKRSDGLLEPVDTETLEAMALVSNGGVFSTEGFKQLGRSSLQNAYLWGWLYWGIADALSECGRVIQCDDGTEIPFTVDILHEWIFADRFRVSGVIIFKGKEKKIYESTAKMSKTRFIKYVDDIKRFCIQYWDFHVPETNRYEGLF